MYRLLPAALCTAGLFGTVDLSTQYSAERLLIVETQLTFSSEVTDSEVLIDGQPPEREMGAGDQAMSMEIQTTHADRVLEVEDGQPTRVQRSYRSLSGSRSVSMGDQENSTDMESPLDGVALEIAMEDGSVSTTVADGAEQEDEQLQGHSLVLSLDALLTDEDVEEDESWDLDSDAILDALGLTSHRVLFPRVRAEGGGERGERGGGGGGGRRGRAGRGGGGSWTDLAALEWEGTAKLTGLEEHEGAECWVVELELEGSGELPEQQGGGGRGRDRAFSLTPTVLPPVGTTVEVELKGRMLLSKEGKHPVLLHLEGEHERETERSMERRDRLIEMSSSSEGTIVLDVAISTESAE